MTARSFGRPEPAEKTKDDDEQAPVPVLHVGEVHANLVLHITDDTKHDLGSQLASVIASAVKQGIEHGVAVAMEQIAGPDDEPVATSPDQVRLTEDDLRRARGG